jgi:hypothetical protein
MTAEEMKKPFQNSTYFFIQPLCAFASLREQFIYSRKDAKAQRKE